MENQEKNTFYAHKRPFNPHLKQESTFNLEAFSITLLRNTKEILPTKLYPKRPLNISWTSPWLQAHFAPNTKFDFHKYIKRSMEDDYKRVIGIRLVLESIQKLDQHFHMFLFD